MMPIFFRIGSVSVYTYGVLSAAGLGLSAWLASRRAARFGFDQARAVDAVLLLFVAGIVGARLFFIFQHLDLYSGAWLRALDFREGGLVWYGGLLVAFGAAFGIVHFFGWKRWAFADFIAPVLSAGHAVGRIGCFFNGCCGGISVRAIHELPVQLIESAFLAILSVYLWKRTGQAKREGDLFLLYVLAYTLARFLLEFLRADQVHYGGFTIPQFTSAVLFGAALFLWMMRHGPRKI